jgi:D-3-phosphoglycerate dehydrogenase
MTQPGRILLLESIHPDAKANLESAGLEVELLKKALPEDELARAVRGCVGLGIRSKTQVTKKVLEAADDLRVIGAFCIGTNQIALREANLRGVPVFNAPFSNTRSVAEMMICEIVMLARRFGDRNSEMHRGVWTKSAEGSREIRGKTLGIVGYGHIGRQVGVLAESFGMNVLFHDVAARLPMGNNRSAHSLDELLGQSDFVALHVPETPQTRDMIGVEQLARMKPGSYLINASRGTVVVIAALADAIRRGHLAGAAIDVFPIEPEGNDAKFVNELQGLPNVILTPHIGGSTAEAQVAIGHEVSHALIRFLQQGTTSAAVNFPHADLPRREVAPGEGGVHRFTHVHRNVPGVLRDVNRIVSEASANVLGQVLATDADIGYLVMDVAEDQGRRVGYELCQRMQSLETTIHARLLY